MGGFFALLNEHMKNMIDNTKPMSTLGDVELEVISEKSRSLPVAVTSRRVEKGFNLTDTTRREQMIINITVVDNSDKYMENREKLEKLQATGDKTRFYFAGRDIYENIIVENIEEVESAEQKNGFTYHITLRQIITGQLSEHDVEVDYKALGNGSGPATKGKVKISKPTPKEESKVNEVLEKGRTKKRGN